VATGDDLLTPPRAAESTGAACPVPLASRSGTTLCGGTPSPRRPDTGLALAGRYRPGIDPTSTIPDRHGVPSDPPDDPSATRSTDSHLRVAVLADTHLRGGVDGLPARARAELDAADVVLHAGDIVERALLAELPEPWHAVLGNNDHGLAGTLPDRLELDLCGVRVAMVHDSGARTGRERRMRRWFPTADVVVFGHSHDPVDTEGIDGQRLFNPGSAVQRRRQPHRTMGVLVLGTGRVVDHRIVVVDD
jgi:putative phosphoesterase